MNEGPRLFSSPLAESTTVSYLFFLKLICPPKESRVATRVDSCPATDQCGTLNAAVSPQAKESWATGQKSDHRPMRVCRSTMDAP